MMAIGGDEPEPFGSSPWRKIHVSPVAPSLVRCLELAALQPHPLPSPHHLLLAAWSPPTLFIRITTETTSARSQGRTAQLLLALKFYPRPQPVQHRRYHLFPRGCGAPAVAVSGLPPSRPPAGAGTLRWPCLSLELDAWLPRLPPPRRHAPRGGAFSRHHRKAEGERAANEGAGGMETEQTQIQDYAYCLPAGVRRRAGGGQSVYGQRGTSRVAVDTLTFSQSLKLESDSPSPRSSPAPDERGG